jgi:hypothetical protein
MDYSGAWRPPTRSERTSRRYGILRAMALSSLQEPSSWAFGWEALVAVGTIGLAFFTAWLAWTTRKLARTTGEDVRAGSRPVVIDVAGGYPTARTPEGANFGEVRLLVRNGGRGPALNVYAYALVRTTNEDHRSDTIMVGSLAVDGEAEVVLPEVQTRDCSGSMESFLALRVVLTYTDLAGSPFFTAIRLSDPNHGQRVHAPKGDDGSVQQPLEQHGAEVGAGAAPDQQWRVVLIGPQFDNDDTMRLRSQGIQYVSGHSLVPGTWSSSVFVSGNNGDEVRRRITDAAGSKFTIREMKPWASDPLGFRNTRWTETVTHRLRRIASRLRPAQRKS